MSRIDQALKMWERAHGTAVSEPDATQPGDSSLSADYTSEAPDRFAPEPPAGAKAAEPAPQLRAVSLDLDRPLVMQGAKLHANAELRSRLVTDKSNTVSLEQYRKLAAALHDWQIESQSKTLMITSAVPHEGKTLTVVNLALTLSESYARRVLVIDADLRAPSLHTVLDIPNDRGLSEALAEDRHELRYTEVSTRLSALTAGTPGPAPLAGLTSNRMAEVLEECATRFDWVLIDTPPAGVLPDAQVLGRLVGGVLFVIGAGSTPAAAVERAVADFGGPEAIIGTVLNRVEEEEIPEVGYYGQYRKSTAHH